MTFAKFLLAAFLLFAGVHPSSAAVRIAGDRGGRIGKHLDRYDAIRTSGETVMIDGLCSSACTMVLGAVSHDKICVTSHANLGFHAAYDLGTKGRAVANVEVTQLIYSHYPSAIRHWITARGGLKSQMIFLRGKELHVPPLLSQRPGVVAALNATRPARMHLWRSCAPTVTERGLRRGLNTESRQGRLTELSWSTPFSDPIELTHGRKLIPSIWCQATCGEYPPYHQANPQQRRPEQCGHCCGARYAAAGERSHVQVGAILVRAGPRRPVALARYGAVPLEFPNAPERLWRSPIVLMSWFGARKPLNQLTRPLGLAKFGRRGRCAGDVRQSVAASGLVSI